MWTLTPPTTYKTHLYRITHHSCFNNRRCPRGTFSFAHLHKRKRRENSRCQYLWHPWICISVSPKAVRTCYPGSERHFREGTKPSLGSGKQEVSAVCFIKWNDSSWAPWVGGDWDIEGKCACSDVCSSQPAPALLNPVTWAAPFRSSGTEQCFPGPDSSWGGFPLLLSCLNEVSLMVCVHFRGGDYQSQV